MNGWIGVDLDGTLAKYNGWQGELHIGEPIQPMIIRIKAWLQAGVKVKIFTARVSNNAETVTEVINTWCLEHIGEILPVTNQKDYAMIELWDDRCVRVIPNTGIRCCEN
jgi:hypothetical protein